MVEQLSKPHASKKKVTTSDKLLEVYRDSILSLLTEGSKLASDIRKGIPELAEVSPQSITAMLNKLTAEGAVVREKGKKGMEYSLA
jgi:DNA-binding HxlR family transcriptional regulator